MCHVKRSSRQLISIIPQESWKKVSKKKWDTVSLLHMNEFHSKSMFVSPICSWVQQSQARYPTNTIDYTGLYSNRFIKLSTQIIHKKQTNTENKTFLIFQYNTLKSTVVQYCATIGIQGLALSEQARGVTDCKKRGGVIWSSWRIISNRRWRANCNFTHIWCWWNKCSHLWKFSFFFPFILLVGG